MNTQANASPESFAGTPAVAAAEISETQRFYWSVRRELWEHRYLYLAPLSVAGLFLAGHLVGLAHLPAELRQLTGGDPAKYREAILEPYNTSAAFMMGTYILVTLYYCSVALHGERRDRSILFWKALPVSDLTTVLSKASIPFVILPLLTFAVTLALQIVILLTSSAVLLANGLGVAALWEHLPILQMSLLLLFHIVTSHALWPAPVYCWLLLVSGWARRAAFLWAALPVLAIAGVEAIAFHTKYFATLIGRRFIGDSDPVTFTAPGHMPTDPMTHIHPVPFLLSPSLWIGLAIAAAFLAAAVRIRRYREPM